MIRSRKSDETLDKDTVLSKVSEYQIFKYYCSHFEEADRKFKSDLREDKTPTVSICKFNGRLWYKDFGCPEHSFDCFSYIGYKYNLDFYGTLIHIDQSFGLGLHTGVARNELVQRREGETRVPQEKRSTQI